MIAERYVSAGEYVLAQSMFASLVVLDPLRLELTISEADVRWVKLGQIVKFAVQAFPDASFEGTVKYIGPSVRENTRDLVVEAVVANTDGRLRPGMFATASLALPDEQLPTVPKSAILREGSLARVYLVVDGRIEEHIVQTGVESGDTVAISDGLKGGETVVTKLGPDVRDGTPVQNK